MERLHHKIFHISESGQSCSSSGIPMASSLIFAESRLAGSHVTIIWVLWKVLTGTVPWTFRYERA